uniref:Uncharacterized protein n=1 Tax=Timema douglasi TaxID=61478 RepID=A0A7R8ZE36_TIMDO|nr:unnamed protein product [Timema douglasi]
MGFCSLWVQTVGTKYALYNNYSHFRGTWQKKSSIAANNTKVCEICYACQCQPGAVPLEQVLLGVSGILYLYRSSNHSPKHAATPPRRFQELSRLGSSQSLVRSEPPAPDRPASSLAKVQSRGHLETKAAPVLGGVGAREAGGGENPKTQQLLLQSHLQLCLGFELGVQSALAR